MENVTLVEALVNLTNCTCQNDTALNNTEAYWLNELPPWWRQVLWTLLFGIMVVIATGGNLIVVWLVLSNKRMRTVTNYFLVNLSIADAMVSSLNVTFNFTYMLHSDWPFGHIYCKINSFIAVISICASVFTLMAVSIDRYMAIMYPLRPRMGRRTTITIGVCIWVASSAIAAPNLVFYTLEVSNNERICYPLWPDGGPTESIREYWYNVIFMILTYFLPIGSMAYTYTRVGIVLWGSKTIGECTQRQLENIKSKRRVVKMMMVVVAIFALCWLPYHTYFIVVSYFPYITYSQYIREIYLAIYWLAMSNAMYNPFIYCWMNSRFRRGFKEFFSWCPGIEVTPALLSRRDPVTSHYSLTASPESKCRLMRNDSRSGHNRRATRRHSPLESNNRKPERANVNQRTILTSRPTTDSNPNMDINAAEL